MKRLFLLVAEADLGVAGRHRLYFRNDHIPELGVYLANALVPATSEIKITGQERDAMQNELRINFQSAPDAASGRLWWAGVSIILIFGLSLLLFLLPWKPSRQLIAVWKARTSGYQKRFVR
jgi:hypothetical protein